MKEDVFDDGFEDFLRDSSDDLRMYPSDRVWQGVRSRMHPAPKWPLLVAGLGIFALGLVTGISLDAGRDTDGSHRASASTPTPAVRPPSDAVFNRQSPVIAGKTTASDGLLTVASTGWQTATDLPDLTFLLRTDSDGDPVPMASHREARVIGWPMSEHTPSLTQSFSLAEKLSGRTHTPQAPAPRVKPQGKPSPQTATETGSTTDRILTGLGRVRRRTNLQLYVTPSVSYRSLIGQATSANYAFSNGFAYSANPGNATDVNDAVSHRPGLGLEAGSAMQYSLTRSLRLRAGLQLNLTNYDIQAFNYTPELAPLSAAPGGGAPPIQTLSYFRSDAGFSRTWLRNSHLMVSMPIGLEYTLAGNRKVSLTVASTIQPTYMLRNKAYLISTNLKNYAEEPALYRRWNLNAGAEAYVSMNTGSYRWIMGPQIRYQLMSSYKQDYPIQEHLIDFGFKVGIQKTIR